MSQNFTVLGGKFAETYTQINCVQNPGFQALSAFITSQGMSFNFSRNIAVIGVNSDPTAAGNQSVSNPYLMVVIPTFVQFDYSQTPSHNAASIVCFVSGGQAHYSATIVNVNHQPLENEMLTYVELDQNNQIKTTIVSREQIVNNTVEGLAAQMGGTPYDPAVCSLLPDSVGVADAAAITSIIFGALTTDTFAAPLYPANGVSTLLQDAMVPAMFSQAIAARAARLAGGINVAGITVKGWCSSCSTSSNACSSTSSSFTWSSSSKA
jgi:hypothetical protein